MIRFDAGELASPRKVGSSVIYTGRAARTGEHSYPWGLERRDSSELRRIADQLTSKPVLLKHPNPKDKRGLVANGAKAWIIGRVQRAWIDDNHVATEVRIDDLDAIRFIDKGANQLSVGYEITKIEDGYQRGTRVDHLAFVHAARCGVSCSVRLDSCSCGCGTCGEERIPERGPVLAVNIMRKLWKKN